MKKIAVIGSGITGVSTCYYLHKLGYEVTLFEGGDHFGGHTHTHEIEFEGETFPVDTGFLVHNDRTYPNLIQFFEELEIEVHKSDMSFSVFEPNDNITWAGTNILTLFGQYRNILSPRFYRFVGEILRFNKNSHQYLEDSQENIHMTLGDLLEKHSYSDHFRRWYLLPMGGCIWSTPVDKMLSFPAHSFLRFCINHGLLQVNDRPQWKSLVGGCKTYVDKALSFVERKYLNEPVECVMPVGEKVLVRSISREEEFDACFFCSHPPETLKMMKDSSIELRNTLSQFGYQKNLAVLHWDKSILPHERFWSAWNYRSSFLDDLKPDERESVSVSYLINNLQKIPVKAPVIVTLNPVCSIDKNKIWKELTYEHPVFDASAVIAQEKIMDYQGEGNLYFSGAWMRYGFHEDGILSAKKVVNKFLENEKSTKKLEIYE